MTDWVKSSALSGVLDPKSAALLNQITAVNIPKDTIIFRPGDAVDSFALVLSGRIGVYMTGTGGREILLYEIVSGQTCIQSTVGIMGDENYSAEAICETDCTVAIIPSAMFMGLISTSSAFRVYVFQAFSTRLQDMMHLLEQVAFVRVENRLAAALLARADQLVVHATHQELATQIGTAREVVSRRLDAMAKRGLVQLERGHITIVNAAALQEFSQKD